jgi:hypothetical protein
MVITPNGFTASVLAIGWPKQIALKYLVLPCEVSLMEQRRWPDVTQSGHLASWYSSIRAVVLFGGRIAST